MSQGSVCPIPDCSCFPNTSALKREKKVPSDTLVSVAKSYRWQHHIVVSLVPSRAICSSTCQSKCTRAAASGAVPTHSVHPQQLLMLQHTQKPECHDTLLSSCAHSMLGLAVSTL